MATPAVLDQLTNNYPQVNMDLLTICSILTIYCLYLTIVQVDSLILCGVEAHVCVQATAMDFIERGLTVSIRIILRTSPAVIGQV